MRNILLVEDDSFLIDIYTRKLKESGFSVKVANNGEEALQLLGKEKPDLIVLDIILPGEINGWQVLKKIKSLPKLKDLKVIILSNLGQKKEMEKGIKLGSIKYLIKAHHTPSGVVTEIEKALKEIKS